MTGESDLIGQVLQNTYRVDRLIGKGGMGMVFGASHVRLTRKYAVKLLNPAVVASSEALRRFQQEAEITNSLGHPHVLEVFDFNHTPDGIPYIVMELLEGETLSTRITRLGKLDFHQVMSIFRQVASALHAVHTQGIIHRDLKPDNIFLCKREGQDDFVKVVDFGISKVLGADSNLTGTHALLGSPYYMAPEQAEQRSADVDVRTDVYGMGVIVYMMLSGRAPFDGASLPVLLYNVVHSAPPSLRLIRPEVPQGVEDALMVALRKDRDHRYQTIEEFWQAFRKAVLDESMGATAVPLSLADTAPMDEDDDRPEVGLRVGNYVIQRQLGEGGMGVVYLAEHPEIGRQVAIKILAAHLLQYPMAAERFVAEAKAVTRIKHSNIIDIYDFGRLEDGRLYYVMEILEGRELKEVMAQGRMTPAEVLPYLEQICGALQAAHDHNVIHRDLKPENIFEVSREPVGIKVLDFGIAKLLEPESRGKGKGMTSTGMVMGSPLTMAPEQAAGMPDRIGPHTDLYSLGVVLYWMLAGLPPFSAEASGLLLAKHITERPPPLREVAPDIPPAVAQVVDQCLEKDPADRPKSATELACAFAAAMQSSAGWEPGPDDRPAIAARPQMAVAPTTMRRAAGELVDVGHAPRKSVAKWIGLAVPLVLGVVAVALVYGGGSSQDSPTKVAAAPAKTPVVDPAPARVRVRLKLRPDNARVFLNGVRQQGAQLELVRSKEHTLRVEAEGYEPSQQTLVARSDWEIVTVTLEKKKSAPVRKPPAKRVSTKASAPPRPPVAPARPPVAAARPPVVSHKPPAVSHKPPTVSHRPPVVPPEKPRPKTKTKTKSKLRFHDLDDGKPVKKPRFKGSL